MSDAPPGRRLFEENREWSRLLADADHRDAAVIKRVMFGGGNQRIRRTAGKFKSKRILDMGQRRRKTIKRP